jgi:hypothetical protein
MSKPEEKVLFAISTDHKDQTPIVLFAIPTAAWEYMKDGKTHTFDLNKAGLPVRVVLFGGKDSESLLKILKQDLAKQGIRVEDRRSEDFSIEKDKP